jgi:hypothetical protein
MTMSKRLISLTCVLLAAASCTSALAAGKGECPIFPRPKEYKVSNGGPVPLAAPTVIVVGEKAKEPEKFAASRLTFVLKKRFGLDAPVVTEKAVPKKARTLLVLGTLKSNALLKSLQEKHAVGLDAFEGKDPMQDAFAIESLKSDGRRQAVLMIGSTPRSVIYAQYAFLETLAREGRKVLYPDMSVRDWSALRYRDWWPGNADYFSTVDALDQVTYARANMTQFRTPKSATVSKATVRECWRRGLKPYGVIYGAIRADAHARAEAEAKAWLDKGCYGIYVSFDDPGMGQDPEGLCNKVTALIKKRFGKVGDRIAVVAGGDYKFLTSGNNRRMRSFRDLDEAIFYITGPVAGAFSTKRHFDDARATGIKNHIWWHNYPMGVRVFNAPVEAPRYHALVPLNTHCWGRFTIDDLRKGGEHMTGMSAQNEAFDHVALQLFWAWDPVHYDHEKARTTVYRQRHGAAAVEAARALDDDLFALCDYFNTIWRRWTVISWTLKDVSKRGEALALVEKMQRQAKVIKAGKNDSYLSDEGYDKYYVESLEEHLAAAKRLAMTDFPDYAVAKRERVDPKGTGHVLKGGAAHALRTKMIGLLWTGKRDEARTYLAGLRKEALPTLNALERELKDMWFTEEYVAAWRPMLDLGHWESVAARDLRDKLELTIKRDSQGRLAIKSNVGDCEILFTRDGTLPVPGAAEVYKGPLELPGSTVILAVARKRRSGLMSRVFEQAIGYRKDGWKVVYTDSDSGRDAAGAKAIDGNLDTVWLSGRRKAKPPRPNEIRIDLGRQTAIKAVGISPRRNNGRGVPKQYELYTSTDGKAWGNPVAAGKFADIAPRMIIALDKEVRARFIRLVFLSDFRSVHFSAVAEVDVFDFPTRPAVVPKGTLRPGLQYRYQEYWYYQGRMLWCRDLEVKEVVRRGVIATPTLQFEGRRGDKFGVVYEGYIKIPKDGIYTFSIASDDGSIIWLDGAPAVNNDGGHVERERSSALSLGAGYHAIRIEFFEKEGEEFLSVSWRPPGGRKQLLPAEVLFHPVRPGAERPARTE